MPSPVLNANATAVMPKCSPGWLAWTRHFLHPSSMVPPSYSMTFLGLKLRDALVRTRVNLINVVRFTLKSLGHPVRNPSSESFHKTVLTDIPAECLPVVQPLLTVLAQVTEQIKVMERDLVRRSKTEYPATQRLQQVAGVGPLTALGFVLKIGDPSRFSRGRDVGAYLGLCPRRHRAVARTNNFASVNAATACCDDYWSVPPVRSRPVWSGLCLARTWPAINRHRECAGKETGGRGRGPQTGGVAVESLETRHRLRTAVTTSALVLTPA